MKNTRTEDTKNIMAMVFSEEALTTEQYTQLAHSVEATLNDWYLTLAERVNYYLCVHEFAYASELVQEFPEVKEFLTDEAHRVLA